MANRQRSVRLPDELWDWIDSLPPKYGADTTAKLQAVLWRGKERLEDEERWIREGEHRERGGSSDTPTGTD
jgi:hypothetical protein